MRKLLSFLAIILFISVIFIQPIMAQEQEETRLAECDLCGYCYGRTVPESWNDCRTCIYPEVTGEASENSTLEIENRMNLAPTPARGRYYTQIGCIITDVKDFSTPEGAAVLVNSILNRLIFPTVGGIALLYLIYGAFTLITSQSNPERLQQGKTMVMGAIIGLIFTLSVVLIVNLIAGQILRVPGTNNNEESVTPTQEPLTPEA